MSGRRQIDLCGLGKKQTLTDPKYWSVNKAATPFSPEDIYKHNPWRAPGTAPIGDACGFAGGTPWAPEVGVRPELSLSLSFSSLSLCSQQTRRPASDTLLLTVVFATSGIRDDTATTTTANTTRRRRATTRRPYTPTTACAEPPSHRWTRAWCGRSARPPR